MLNVATRQFPLIERTRRQRKKFRIGKILNKIAERRLPLLLLLLMPQNNVCFIIMCSCSAWLHNRNHLFAIRAMQFVISSANLNCSFVEFISTSFYVCYTCSFCMYILILFDVITTEIDWFHSLIAFGKLSLLVRGTVVVLLISLSNTCTRCSLLPILVSTSFPCQKCVLFPVS